MTDEIIKLYENAGIKPTYTDECQMADSYYSMERDLNERGILFDDYMKQECPNKNEVCYETCPYAYNKEFYPPFTAEKQLKILCFIVNNKHSVIFHDQVFGGDRLTLEKIQEDLAWAINRIWQSLTEEEKQQVKRILE